MKSASFHSIQVSQWASNGIVTASVLRCMSSLERAGVVSRFAWFLCNDLCGFLLVGRVGVHAVPSEEEREHVDEAVEAHSCGRERDGTPGSWISGPQKKIERRHTRTMNLWASREEKRKTTPGISISWLSASEENRRNNNTKEISPKPEGDTNLRPSAH